MVLFDLCNETEALRQFRESLFLGSLGKVLIHVGPFVIFAGGSGSQGGTLSAPISSVRTTTRLPSSFSSTAR